MSFANFSPLQRSLLSAFGAFIVYGGWGYYVNSDHALQVSFKAGFVQGSYSFLLTLMMTVLIEAIYSLISRYVKTKKLSKVMTILITCLLIFSTSWWVNVLAGTPEIFNTVILGYVFGGVFTISYVFSVLGENSRD